METTSPTTPIPLLTESTWLIEIVIGFALLFIVTVGVRRVIRRVRKKWASNPYDWRSKLDYIIYLPLHFLVWTVAIVYAIDVLSIHFKLTHVLDYIKPLRNVAIVIFCAWILLRWIKAAQTSFIAQARRGKHPVDTGTVHAIGRIFVIIVLLVALLCSLQLLGLNLLPLLAFGGIGAAAIGFAGKDMIANFFGGLMIHLTRPFTVGDQIILVEKNIEGTVEEIGWYLTSIRDKDKRAVYLPNSLFSSVLVSNISRMTHRKVSEVFALAYEDFSKLRTIMDQIKEFLLQHPRIDQEQPILVYLHAFKEYSFDMHLEFFTLATQYEEFVKVKEEALMQIQEILKTNSVKAPYPTTKIELIK